MIENIGFAIAGGLGGLINAIIEGDWGLFVPAKEQVTVKDPKTGEKKRTYVYLGVIGSVIVATVVGYFMGTDLKTAFAAGVAAPLIVEGIFEKVKKQGD